MSTNKPTPGPWHIVTSEFSNGIYVDDEHNVIAEIQPFFIKDRPDNRLADARLVSVSPLMLGALEQVFEWLMEFPYPDDVDGYYDIAETVRLALMEAVERNDDDEEGIQ